jgi:tyrosinase
MQRTDKGVFTRFARTALSRRAMVRGTGAGAAALALGGTTATLAVEATPAVAEAGAGALRVRPNAATLTPDQKAAFVNAVLELKRKPSPWVPGLNTYDTFVLWHRDAFGCGIGAAHMGPAFFPWHRMYLHLFEGQLREVDPTVNLPYWDWTVDNGVDSYVWQDDFMGGDGDDAEGEAVTTGPFRKGAWKIAVFDYTDTHRSDGITRDLGRGGLAPDLPTADQVEEALAVPTYDAVPWNAASPVEQSFRNFMEGWRVCGDTVCDPTAGVGTSCDGDHLLHNRVHLWVAGEFMFAHELRMGDMHGQATPDAEGEEVLGTMAANSSPNDPVFFLHHANIDRIWNLWLPRHGHAYAPVAGGPVGHNLDDAMWPYHQIGMEVTPRMMLESRKLGYVYDTDHQVV